MKKKKLLVLSLVLFSTVALARGGGGGHGGGGRGGGGHGSGEAHESFGGHEEEPPSRGPSRRSRYGGSHFSNASDTDETEHPEFWRNALFAIFAGAASLIIVGFLMR